MRKKFFNISDQSLIVAKVVVATIIGIIGILYILFAPIPVLLSYDANYWIDQYGHEMKAKSAERFFACNPVYTWEIISLNKNGYYATSLQNKQRAEVLNDLYKRFYLRRFRFLIDLETKGLIENTTDFDVDLGRITYVTAVHRMILMPPSDSAFNRVLHHVGAGSAHYEIKDLMELCAERRFTSQDYDEITCYKQNYGELVSFIFFGTIAKYYSEDADVLCECVNLQ